MPTNLLFNETSVILYSNVKTTILRYVTPVVLMLNVVPETLEQKFKCNIHS